jgi:hypothetical protein
MIHQSKTKRKCKVKRVCDRTPPAVRQAKILAYIEEHGSSSTRALAEAHGWQSSTTRAHADELCDQHKLHRTRVQRSDGGRDVIFNLGPAPIDPYTDEPAQADSFEHCSRPVLKSWPPCHKRDPLDCFLFGVPAAMAEAHP